MNVVKMSTPKQRITLQEYLSLRLLVKLEFDIKSDIREQCHTLKRISGLSELIYKEI